MSHRGLTSMESTSTASSMVLSTSSLSLASPTKDRNKRGNHARKPSKDGLADSTDSREQSPRERPSSISQLAKESPRGKHSDLDKLVSPREGSSERKKKKKHKDAKDESVASGATDTGSAELSFGGSGEGATTTSTTSSHAEKSLTKSKKSARSEYGSRRGISSTGDFRSRSVELSREESDISVPESSTLTTTSSSKRHHHHKEVQEHTDMIISPRSSSKKSHKSSKHHTVVDTYSSASALGHKDKDNSSLQATPASASTSAASGSLVSSVSSASFHAKTPGTRHRSGSSKQFGSSEDTRDSESLTVDFLDSDDDDDDTIQANKKDSDQSIDFKRHSGRTSPSSSAKTFKSSHSSNKSSPTSDIPLPPPLPPSTPKQKPPRAHRHSMMTTKRVETLRLADLPSHGFDGHTHKKKRERRRSNDLTESPMDDDDSPSPRGSSNSGSIDDPESGKMMKRKTWNKIPKNEELAETGPTTIDLVTEETYKAHRITPTPGYLIDTVRDEPGGGSSIAQQELAYERWLLDTFHSGSQEYTIHYVPVDNQPIDDILFITVKTEYAPDFKELIGIKILVTYEDRDQKIIISHAQLRASGKTILKGSSKRTVSVRKLLEYISPALNKHNVRRIRANSEILDGLLTLARLRLSYCHADKHFKVGALYWSGDKDDEETLSANGSPAFNEFVSHLGEVVQLENWDKFAGGLDITSRSMDGKASLFTEWKGNQIMYHVAPLMECSAHQKRVHIGNDTLVVVFVDSKKNFKAEYIQSKFNQVFVVVSVETDESAIAKAIASSSSHSQHASTSSHHHGHHIGLHTPPPSKTPLSLTLTPPVGSSGNNGIGISAGGSASTGKKRRVTSASTALSPLPDHSPTKESLSPRHTHGHPGSHVLSSSSTRHGGSSEKTARSSSAFSNPTSRRDSLGSVDTTGTSRTENTQIGISPSSGGSLGTSGHSGGRSLPARSSPLEMELREADEDSGAQGDDESPIKRSKLLGASSYSGSPLDSPLTISNPPSADLYSPHSAMSGSLPETPHSSRRTRSSSHLDDIPEIPYNQSSADSHATASSSTATMNTSSTEIPPVEDFPGQHNSLTASMPEFTSPSGKKKKRRGGSMLASGAPADSASVASNTAHSNPEIPSSRPPVVDAASSSAARRRNKHKDNSQVGSTTQSLPSDTWYRVSVLRRCGIDPFRPKLPFPAVLQAGPEFREWLLTKITSGMIAAFSSPNFQDRVQANRSTYLTNLCRAIEKVDF